jgi:transketolase
MGASVNGLIVSGIRAFGATFFNFSDYMRASIRLAALMEIPSIFIFTHDSIGVGEDGPTHQPVEQLASLRAMPNLVVLRPADANEVVEAWKIIAKLQHQPTALVLTRQAVPTFDRTKYGAASGTAKGAYILADAPGGKPDVILMGTGSEVSLCVEAYEKLKLEGVPARVVSMPSWDIFERQDAAYKESVLPSSVTARVSVEMAATFGWERYVGLRGRKIGMHRFGASAPLKDSGSVCRAGRKNRRASLDGQPRAAVPTCFKEKSSCSPLEFWRPQKPPTLCRHCSAMGSRCGSITSGAT